MDSTTIPNTSLGGGGAANSGWGVNPGESLGFKNTRLDTGVTIVQASGTNGGRAGTEGTSTPGAAGSPMAFSGSESYTIVANVASSAGSGRNGGNGASYGGATAQTGAGQVSFAASSGGGGGGYGGGGGGGVVAATGTDWATGMAAGGGAGTSYWDPTYLSASAVTVGLGVFGGYGQKNNPHPNGRPGWVKLTFDVPTSQLNQVITTGTVAEGTCPGWTN